jgi:hypothetical protein
MSKMFFGQKFVVSNETRRKGMSKKKPPVAAGGLD